MRKKRSPAHTPQQRLLLLRHAARITRCFFGVEFLEVVCHGNLSEGKWYDLICILTPHLTSPQVARASPSATQKGPFSIHPTDLMNQFKTGFPRRTLHCDSKHSFG